MSNRIDAQRGRPAESFVSALSNRQHTHATLATRTAIHASVFFIIVTDAPAKHITRMHYPWSTLTDRGLLYRLRAVSFFSKIVGKNRKRVKVRAWMWACRSGCRRLATSPLARQTHGHTHTLTCFAFFPMHGFSRKRDTARSLVIEWKLEQLLWYFKILSNCTRLKARRILREYQS